MVALRDGRKLLGILRSWDQFGKAFLGSLGTTRHANPKQRTWYFSRQQKGYSYPPDLTTHVDYTRTFPEAYS